MWSRLVHCCRSQAALLRIADGARLAVKKVNENGGVLGGKVALVTTDLQTTGVAAVGAMNQLVTIDKVPAVICAAGSGVSLAVIDIAVNNHIVRISPSNTAPDFTTHPDDGFYYRTVPSDALQGKAMAKLENESGYVNVESFYYFLGTSDCLTQSQLP
ncbi:MAG: ABC transporter substrate-binding protein [Euryarchaeota archaeon]|nr:ABC transporter substrate-binding protein [Euryarchaeota archaeon]